MSVLRVLDSGLVDLPFLHCMRPTNLRQGRGKEDYITGTRLD
jgi:hypothetical protein